MEWVEATGRTVDAAKDAAIAHLGVGEEDVQLEVLVEPKTGLFGRVRTEARVRARVRPAQPRAKEERRTRHRGRTPASRRPSDRSTRVAVRERGDAVDGDGEGDHGVVHAPGHRGGVDGVTGGADDEAVQGGTMDGPTVPIAEQGAIAAAFLRDLFVQLEMPVDVTATAVDDETVEVAVNGRELGPMIGPRGATLEALQVLTSMVVQRQTQRSLGRVVVDVADYRQKRRAALERFSRQVALEAQASGSPRVLEPMSAADRKVVHDLVNTIEGVTTRSEGDEPRRRVVIVPDQR